MTVSNLKRRCCCVSLGGPSEWRGSQDLMVMVPALLAMKMTRWWLWQWRCWGLEQEKRKPKSFLQFRQEVLLRKGQDGVITMNIFHNYLKSFKFVQYSGGLLIVVFSVVLSTHKRICIVLSIYSPALLIFWNNFFFLFMLDLFVNLVLSKFSWHKFIPMVDFVWTFDKYEINLNISAIRCSRHTFFCCCLQTNTKFKYFITVFVCIRFMRKFKLIILPESYRCCR